MKHYEYDKDGVFTGEVAAQVDPLESKLAGESVYTKPGASATGIKPPLVGDGKVAVFDGQDWVVKSDYRGETIYSVADKSVKQVAYLGDIEEGYTLSKPGEFDEWLNGGWVTNQEKKLAAAHQSKLSEINSKADAQLAAITRTYPSSELLSWDKQEAEARAWLADETVSTPMVDSIVHSRGLDKALLVQKIIEKADSFAALSGQVFGCRQKLEADLEALTTAEEKLALEVIF